LSVCDYFQNRFKKIKFTHLLDLFTIFRISGLHLNKNFLKISFYRFYSIYKKENYTFLWKFSAPQVAPRNFKLTTVSPYCVSLSYDPVLYPNGPESELVYQVNTQLHNISTRY